VKAILVALDPRKVQPDQTKHRPVTGQSGGSGSDITLRTIPWTVHSEEERGRPAGIKRNERAAALLQRLNHY